MKTENVEMERVAIAETFGIEVDNIIDSQGNEIVPSILRPKKPGPLTPKLQKHSFTKDLVKWVILADSKTNERRLRPLMLVGDKGCGKTQGIYQMAARMHRDVIRIQCAADKDLDYFIGRPSIENGNVVWVDGVLTQAWRRGLWVILDEFDYLLPHVASALNGPLEGEDIILETKGGTIETMRIKRHPNTRVFGTSNTGGVPTVDPRFNSAEQQNSATMDRWWVINVDYPEPEVEKEIIKDAVPGLEDSSIDLMLQYAGLIRSAFRGQEMNDTFSTRSVIDWAELSCSFGDLASPLSGVFFNKLDAVSKDKAIAILDEVLGIKVAA